MKRPEKIKIVGFTYNIKWVSDDGLSDDYLGCCDTNGLVLTIASKQPPTALANTFLHEVIHAINYSMGITSGDEERLTNRLANGLCTVWSENPKALEWWCSLIKPTRSKPRKAKK